MFFLVIDALGSLHHVTDDDLNSELIGLVKNQTATNSRFFIV